MKKIALWLMVLVLMTASVSALPVVLEKVEVNDVEITPNDVTRLDILRDNDFDIELVFTPIEDMDDVEIEFTIYGFEFNDISRVEDSIDNSDYDAGVTYIRRFTITLPDEIDEDDYKLRLIMADRNGDELIQSYNLKIDVPRHKLKIEDVIFFPFNEVEAGRALLTTVRIENKGEKDEQDIRVAVNIPELGLSAVDYIDEIDTDDEEETEEIFIAVPVCTKAGTYTAHIEVAYDQLTEVERVAMPITITESNRCEEHNTEVIASVIVIAPETSVETSVEEVDEKASPMKVVRKVLEVVLLALIALLAIIGLIIGFGKIGKNTDF